MTPLRSAPVHDGGVIALPHNLEAEQGLLGALLFDNRTLDRICALAPGDFFDPVHGRIYAAIAAGVRSGRLMDAVTLRPSLADDAGLAELGGPAAYLMRLMESAAPMNAQAQSYALLIRDLAARRAIYRICQDAAREALAPSDPHADAVDIAMEAERALQAIGGGASAREISLRDAGQLVVDSLSKPYRGLSTGIAEIDKLIGGLIAPDLIIIAGRPGMGKSSLAMNIALNVASDSVVSPDGELIRPRVVAFFSMEMSAEQLAGRALSRRSTAPGAMAFGYSSLYAREFRPRPDQVAPLLLRLPDTLRIDDGASQTMAHIRASCRDIRSRFGALDLVVVDYLQLAIDPAARKDGKVQEVSAISAALKGLAKDMNIPVIALSQLSRAVESRLDKTPQNSDLRESGAIEQDADVILFAYREHYYLSQSEPRVREGEDESDFDKRKREHAKRKFETQNIFTAICGKRRNGPVGVAELRCDLAHDIIADPEPGTEPPARRKPYWQD